MRDALRSGAIARDPPATATAAILASAVLPPRHPWLPKLPVCKATVRLAKAAVSPWSPTRHWLYHGGFRAAVHTLLLVSERGWRLAEAGAGDGAEDDGDKDEADEDADEDEDEDEGGDGGDVMDLAAVLRMLEDDNTLDDAVEQAMGATRTAVRKPGPLLPCLVPELWFLLFRHLRREDFPCGTLPAIAKAMRPRPWHWS